MGFIDIIELFRLIGLIGICLLSLILFLIAVFRARKRGFTRQGVALIILSLGALFIVYLAFNVREITPADWAQIMLTIGLVAVTGAYAFSASKQADSSAKMAEEMKEQRLMTSRPFIIQRAEQKKAVAEIITTDYFSHFEIYNTGNGPAIELEISLLNEEKGWIYSERQSYLRTGESVKLLPVEFEKEQALPDIEPPVKLVPVHLIAREKQTYLVSEYQNIFSDRKKPTWYQTWLPFEGHKASKKGEIYIKPGELEFREVKEKDRIDAFVSKSKPK
jgi:hypothetical protein